MADSPDDYLKRSLDAGRMGKAAEYLVAAVCILATRGRLNVSTSIVDDEGVDWSSTFAMPRPPSLCR